LDQKWINLLKTSVEKKNIIDKISNFHFTNSENENHLKTDKLFVKKIEEKIYLASVDCREKIEVDSNEEFPFDKIANNLGLYFEYDQNKKVWVMKNRNPNIEIE
jgi:hypothetical protein